MSYKLLGTDTHIYYKLNRQLDKPITLHAPGIGELDPDVMSDDDVVYCIGRLAQTKLALRDRMNAHHHDLWDLLYEI